jgi:O-antigen ligase
MYKIAALLLTISLASAYRIRTPDWIFGSVSLFDLTLAVLAVLMLPFFKFRTPDVAIVSNKQPDPARNNEGKERRLFLLLALPLIVGCISVVWAQNLIEPTKYLVSFSEALLAYFAAATVFTAIGPHTTARAVGAIVILLLVGSALSYLNVPGFDPEKIYFQDYQNEQLSAFLASYYSRLSHPFVGLSNAFAGVLSFYLFLLWTYGRVSGKKHYVYLAGLTFFAVVATLSRGVIVAVILASIVFIRVQKIRIQVSVPGLIAVSTLIAGVLAFIFLAPEGRDLAGYDLSVLSSLESRMSDVTISSRREIADFALERIAERPVLGYGAGVKADNSELLDTTAHNTYIEQILNYGIALGLFLCVSFVLVMLHFFDLRQLTSHQATVSKGVGIAVLSQLLIFVTQASFEGYLLKVIYYFSIGMGVAMIRNANGMVNLVNPRK